jgi:Concanavalin A-like lectin/glucanases superfamily
MNKLLSFLFVFTLLAISAWKFKNDDKTIIWKLNAINRIGGFKLLVLGNPTIKVEENDTSIYFNGINDGLVIPAIPIEGWPEFTIEVLFKPAGDGSTAPRFIHFEDIDANRGTLELRLTKYGQWYFDGFLKNGKTNKGLALIDSTKLHPTNRWYWAALVYDGKKMYSYINGKKELEGEIDFPPMTKGNISLGVRLNKVNWFKGQIQEIRFHSEVLQAQYLQHF